MEIRELRGDDAEFCFATRTAAFIEKFYDEVGPQIVSLCVTAYPPAAYVALAEKAKVFIVEDGGERVGFCTVKRVDDRTAEVPLIYFRLDRLGRGYGGRAMRVIEEWIRTHWPEVDTLRVDTIIPANTAGFYRKMGFDEVGEAASVFSGQEVTATRFEKTLGRPSDVETTTH